MDLVSPHALLDGTVPVIYASNVQPVAVSAKALLCAQFALLDTFFTIFCATLRVPKRLTQT